MEQQSDRRDAMISAMHSCMEHIFLESCRQIQAELNENGETVWEELETALWDVLNQAVKAKDKGRKGDIHYLAFSFLKSGIYLDRLEWHINALDDGFYLDETETAGYYTPAFLNFSYVKDLEELRKALGKEFIRIQNFEWDRVKEVYAGYYDAFMFSMVESLKERIAEEMADSGMTADGCRLIYGEYMDKAEIICEVQGT